MIFGPAKIAGEPSWDEYELWKALQEELGEDSQLSIEHIISLGLIERTYMIMGDGSLTGIRAFEEMRGRDFMATLTNAMTIHAELEQTVMGTLLYRACSPITAQMEGTE